MLALALFVFAGALRSIVQVNLDAAINRSLMQEARGHQRMTARMLESRPDGFGSGTLQAPDPRGPDFRPGFGLRARRPGPGPDFQGISAAESLGTIQSRLSRPSSGRAGTLAARVLDLHERALTGWSASMPWDPDTFPLSARGQEVTSTIRVGSQSRARLLRARSSCTGEVVGVVQTAASLS